MKKTKEEIGLLEKLTEGLLDGLVGDDLTTSGGSRVWTSISKGYIARYKEGPSTKFFDGKETESVPGKKTLLQEWKTDDEKISFFRKFGWLIPDEDTKRYSAKFKGL